MTDLHIDRLDHLVLTVADVAATCEFYHRVLGMEVDTFGEGRKALRFGLQGEQFNLNAASSSGAQALALAARWIALGELDLALVVGAEPALGAALREASRRSGAMAVDGTSRPLSAERAGMVPRESAAALVLEREDRARARGAPLLARVAACVSGNEAHHLVAPLPGQGLSDRLLQRLRLQLGSGTDGHQGPGLEAGQHPGKALAQTMGHGRAHLHHRALPAQGH
jgi:3-oxoacyl-(acyl-carrier-protein) synthase